MTKSEDEVEVVQEEEEYTQNPKISMDYFFLGGSRSTRMKDSVANMTTKELRKKLMGW